MMDMKRRPDDPAYSTGDSDDVTVTEPHTLPIDGGVAEHPVHDSGDDDDRDAEDYEAEFAPDGREVMLDTLPSGDPDVDAVETEEGDTLDEEAV